MESTRVSDRAWSGLKGHRTFELMFAPITALIGLVYDLGRSLIGWWTGLSLASQFLRAGSTVLMPDRLRDDLRVIVAWSKPFPEMAGKDLTDIARGWNTDIRSAAEKLRVCEPSSRWFTSDFLLSCTNSIGSSTVRMCE